MAAASKNVTEDKSANDTRTLKNEVNETVPPDPDMPQRRETEKTLFEWKTKARPFKRRDRKFWTTIITVAAFFGLILYIIEGAAPVFLIIALIFLYYVLTTVEPPDVEYKITTYGVRFADELTEWPFLIRFWFSDRYDESLIVFDTVNFPGRLEMVINKEDKDKLAKVIDDYIPEEKLPPSNIEKAANWFSNKIPGN